MVRPRVAKGTVAGLVRNLVWANCRRTAPRSVRQPGPSVMARRWLLVCRPSLSLSVFGLLVCLLVIRGLRVSFGWPQALREWE